MERIWQCLLPNEKTKSHYSVKIRCANLIGRYEILKVRRQRPPTNKKNKLVSKFEKLLKTNRTIKDTEIKMQLMPGHTLSKQKTRSIPYHLQSSVEKEINNLIQSGHLEKTQNIEEDSFLFSIVETVNKHKSLNIALASKKLNDSCTKMKPHMPKMEELGNETSNEITRVQTNQYGYRRLTRVCIWSTKTLRLNK